MKSYEKLSTHPLSTVLFTKTLLQTRLRRRRAADRRFDRTAVYPKQATRAENMFSLDENDSYATYHDASYWGPRAGASSTEVQKGDNFFKEVHEVPGSGDGLDMDVGSESVFGGMNPPRDRTGTISLV